MSISGLMLALKIIYFIFSFANLMVMLLYVFTNIYNSKLINKKNTDKEFQNYLYLLTAFYASIFAISIAIFVQFEFVFIFYWFNLVAVFGVIGTVIYYYFLTDDIKIEDNYILILLSCFAFIMLICSVLTIIYYYKIKAKQLSREKLAADYLQETAPPIWTKEPGYSETPPKQFYGKDSIDYSWKEPDILLYKTLYNDDENMAYKARKRMDEDAYNSYITAKRDSFRALIFDYKDNKDDCKFLLETIGGDPTYKAENDYNINMMFNIISDIDGCENNIGVKNKLANLLGNKYNTGEEGADIRAANAATNKLLFIARKFKELY